MRVCVCAHAFLIRDVEEFDDLGGVILGVALPKYGRTGAWRLHAPSKERSGRTLSCTRAFRLSGCSEEFLVPVSTPEPGLICSQPQAPQMKGGKIWQRV